MSASGYKRLAIALGALCVVLIVLYSFLFWKHGWLSIRVAWADDQTRIFEEMRVKALQRDAVGAADCLQYVVDYYPSGSKQETGSQLDRMVESERAWAARDIIAYLRTKTGEDLGENTEAWIQKYMTR